MMLRLVRKSDGQVVVEELSVASSFLARFRGLMGRARLAVGEGLWLAQVSSIHMFFMRFAIDVLFLRAMDTSRRERNFSSSAPQVGDQMEIMKISAGVLPWVGLAWCTGAASCVEVAAGLVNRVNLQQGDVLEVKEGR